MRRIGVFGGMFDPIHFGHLRTGLEIRHALSLDELRFVPCGAPPHRESPVSAAALRLRMVEAAIAGHAGFRADAREIERSGPSYTYETLASLRAELPDAALCLIVGMDAFLSLPSWHRAGELLGLAHVVVAHRPGWQAPRDGEIGALLARHGTGTAAELGETPAGRIHIEPVTQLEVSSSELRRSIRAGLPPTFLMPDSVREIIRESGCYD